MAREAKHALMFLGILLLVFGGLLWKHMKSPGAALHLFTQSEPKTAESAALIPASLSTQPTLVTPHGENDRPPELAIANTPQRTDRNSSARADDQNRPPASTWSATNPRAESTTVDVAKPSASPPPSLLATPAPISTVGDRYAARTQQDSPDRSTSDQTSAPLAGAAPLASADASPTAKPYSSAYPSASDDKSSTPAPVTTTPIEIPAKPLPQVAQETPPQTDYRNHDNSTSAYGSSNSRYETGLTRIDATSPQYDTQPTAGIAASSPRSTPQYLPPSSSSATNSYTASPPPPTNRYAVAPPTATANPWASAANSSVSAAPQYSNTDLRTTNSTGGSITNLYGDVSAPATSPVQRDGNQYTVGPNDSFWAISQKTYGTGAFFKALYEHNRKRMKDPNDLKIGQVLLVPDEATLRRLYPDLCPKPRKPEASPQQRMITASARLGATGRMYTVADGDTLFEIARHELGKPSRWAEIYQLNHDVLGDDFDYLRAGTQLILPADAAAGANPANRIGPAGSNTATRQPDAFYPR